MELIKKLLFILVFLRHSVICDEFGKITESLEEVFESIGPKNLLSEFEKTEQFEENSHDTCRAQLRHYLNGIRKKELWALKMLDSSSKIPSGILIGNIVDLGMFDECMSVKVNYKRVEIQGRHCQYALTLKSLNDTRLKPTLSICVPSGCDVNDVTIALNKTIHALEHINDFGITDVTVMCSNVNSLKWSTASILWLTTISAFVLFIIICTILEIIQSKKSLQSKVMSILGNLSLRKSASKILSTELSSDSLRAVHGIRVLSICWIVFGHQYITTSMIVNVNNLDILDWISSWNSLYILLAPFAVDTFLTLSGLLITYWFLKAMAEGKKFNIFTFYLHRYIRLTPPVMALLIFTMFIIPHMGSGPRWEQYSISSPNNYNEEKWWAFLLYINNYFAIETMCLGHLWYLAVDMQYFWISPIILYPLAKKPKLGMIIWCLLFVSQIVTPAVIIAINKYTISLTSIVKLDLNVFRTMFQNSYEVAYTRGSSWLIGVLVGYLIATKQFNFNKKTVYIGWIVTFVCLTLCTLGQWICQRKDYVYNIVWETIYGSFARPLWAIAVGWIVLASFRGHGGPINTLLSLRIFLPLSRISYCLYLVHLVIECMKAFAMRTPNYFTDFYVFNNFLGSLTISIVIAFFFSLFFEAPFLELEKIALKMSKRENEESREQLYDTDGEIEDDSVEN